MLRGLIIDMNTTKEDLEEQGGQNIRDRNRGVKQKVGSALEGTAFFTYAVQLNRLYEYIHFKYDSFVSGEVTIEVEDSQAAIRPKTAEEWRNVKRRIPNEMAVIEHLRGNIQSDDVFWDVGANIGVYSCLASQFVREGQIVAFEPYPPNVALLKKNIQYNNVDNVVMNTTALSDTQGTTEFYLRNTSQGGAQNGTTSSQRANNSVESVDVAVTPGDVLVRNSDIPAPNVLKIDVEGTGPEVLQGLKTTLESDVCRLAYVEPHQNADRLREILRSYEFNILTIELARDDDEEGTIVACK